MNVEAQCLVVGGGVAGYGAACAAALAGVDTVLVERHGFCGGMGTAASLTSFINYHQTGSLDLSDGVYRDLVRRVYKIGGLYRAKEPHVDFFDLEDLKYAMESKLQAVGATVFYHCAFDSIKQNGDGYIARFAGKGDEVIVHARYVIDATGDADVCAKAGVPVTYGRNGDAKMSQPMSMIVQLGGFEFSRYAAAGYAVEPGGHVCDSTGWNKEVSEARLRGQWTIPKDHLGMWWSAPRDPSHVFCNGTRIQGLLGCCPEQLSKAEMIGRTQSREIAAFFRHYIPGFENSHLLATGPQIGVRETRRIVGRYTLTTEDVLKGRVSDDAIAICAYPMDIHAAQGDTTHLDFSGAVSYGIPFRCLQADGFPNILAAGRCISADHEAAGSFRVMPTCMSLGEAAGTAVAIAISSGIPLQAIRGTEVRSSMNARRGVFLTDPDSGAFLYESLNENDPNPCCT